MLDYERGKGSRAGEPPSYEPQKKGRDPPTADVSADKQRETVLCFFFRVFLPAVRSLGPPFLSLESGLRDPLSSQDRSQVNFNPAKRGFRLGLLYRVFPFPPLFFPDVSIIEACQSANTTDLSAPLSACCDFQGPAPLYPPPPSGGIKGIF